MWVGRFSRDVVRGGCFCSERHRFFLTAVGSGVGSVPAGAGQVGVQGGAAVEPGCLFDRVGVGAGFNEPEEGFVFVHRVWCARPGTKRNVEERSDASRFQPRWTRSRMCGLGQCSNRTLWKSWFSRVKRTGSKCCRHSRMSSFTARAAGDVRFADQGCGQCGGGALDDAQGLHRVEVLGGVDRRTPWRRRSARTSPAPRLRAGGWLRGPEPR